MAHQKLEYLCHKTLTHQYSDDKLETPSKLYSDNYIQLYIIFS